MKTKLFTLLLTMSAVLTLSAQTSKDVQKEVRALYAQANEKMKQVAKDPMTGCVTKSTTSIVFSGVGLCEVTMECLYDNRTQQAGEEEDYQNMSPLFIRKNFVRKQSDWGNDYAEFLFHPETGALVFCYQRNSNVYAEEPVWDETRYYFDRQGHFSTGLTSIKSKETGKSMEGIIPDILPPTAEDARNVKDLADKYRNAFWGLQAATHE